MKRGLFLLVLPAALLLAGCSEQAPETVPGWDESWAQFGGYVGVEPLEGFSLSENMDALAINGIYYADWTCGPEREITNAQGQEAKAYDAQMYLLLEACRDAEKAGSEAAAWLAREKQSYETGETFTVDAGGQTFTVLPLLSGSEDNPYTHGAAAFSARGSWAISVELLCGDGFIGDAQETLERFLAGFHYSDE